MARLHDETAVFSQRGHFQLISYHLVQKGPAFERPLEMMIDCPSGHVTVRYKNEDGQEKVEDEHMDLPGDLANGLIPILLKNVQRDALPSSVSFVAATPKPRLVKLAIAVAGTDPFSIAGSARKATHYVLKVDIGGIAGLLRPTRGEATAGLSCLDIGRRSSGLRAIASADVHGRTGLADGPREPRLAPRAMSHVDVGPVVVSIEDARPGCRTSARRSLLV